MEDVCPLRADRDVAHHRDECQPAPGHFTAAQAFSSPKTSMQAGERRKSS